MEHMPVNVKELWKEKCIEIDKKLAKIGLTGKFEIYRKFENSEVFTGADIASHQEFQFEPVRLKEYAHENKDKKMEIALEQMVAYRNEFGMKPPEAYTFEMDLDEEKFALYLPRRTLTWEQEQYQNLRKEKQLTNEHMKQLREGMEQRGCKQEITEISLQQMFNPKQALKDVKNLLRKQQGKRLSYIFYVEVFLETEMEVIADEVREFFINLPQH